MDHPNGDPSATHEDGRGLTDEPEVDTYEEVQAINRTIARKESIETTIAIVCIILALAVIVRQVWILNHEQDYAKQLVEMERIK